MKYEVDYIKLLARMAEDLPPVANARICSCSVYKGEIISYGFNQYKTHPVQQRFGGILKPYLHSEIDCLVKSAKRLGTKELAHTSLFIARIKRPSTWSREWVLGNAKPCPGCARCIDYFGIGKVIYS